MDGTAGFGAFAGQRRLARAGGWRQGENVNGNDLGRPGRFCFSKGTATSGRTFRASVMRAFSGAPACAVGGVCQLVSVFGISNAIFSQLTTCWRLEQTP